MPSKYAYHLINPVVEGSLQELVYASNARNAAKKIYKQMSEHFTNHMEEFYMTVMDVESKVLSHYVINEKRKGSQIDFVLNPLEGNLPQAIESGLISKATANKKGGRHSSSSSSSSSDSSSSSSDSFTYMMPITKFTYFHLPYHRLFPDPDIKIMKIFSPVLNLPISPVIEINFELYIP